MPMKKRTRILYFLGGPVPTLEDEHTKLDLEYKFRADVLFRNGAVDHNGKPEACDYVFGKDVDGQTTVPADYARFPLIGADLESVMAAPVDGPDPEAKPEGSALAQEIGSVPPQGGGWNT